MALRSGLLMESTWALDTLNILTFDDNAVTYFGLGNMPGLLEALIEQWRASLIAMFDLTKDLEISNAKYELNRKRKRDKLEKSAQGVKWYERRSESEDEEHELGCVDGDVLRRGDKVRILHHQPKDFTQECRFREKDFQFEEKDSTLFVSSEDKNWDEVALGFDAGPDLWAAGGGDVTDHIVPANALWPESRATLPFVRVIPSGKEEVLVKKESDSTPASPTKEGRKPGKRVREQWTVSPTKAEEKPCSSNSSNNTTTHSSSNSNSSSDSNNSNTSRDTATNPVKSEDNICDVSAVKSESDITTEDVIASLLRRTGITVRGEGEVRRRWRDVVREEENYQPDTPSLNLVHESEDALGRRAVAVSTIFRNLSFVPGNEGPLGGNPSFLAVAGAVLLHGHWHPERTSKQRNYDKGEEEETSSDTCTSLMPQTEWWWEHLQTIRENVMVALSNVSGHMDLSPHPENVVLPLLSGLLEWAVSPASVAQDPFPTVGLMSNISPQRLAIETLCKLCIQDGNVDLILCTPPYSRLENLCSFLSKKLYRSEDQVMREFAINLLFYLSGADSGVARTIALQDTTVSLLIGFIEQAENNAMVVAQQHGVNALRDNPDSMGTSLDMLRRAANTLNNLARHKANRPIFVRQEQRLLNLVMSQILDQGVAGIVSQVIFQISRDDY